MANARAVIDIDINASPAAAELRRLQSQINGFSAALNKANTEQGLAAKGISRQLSDLVNSSKFFTAETVRMQTSAAQLDNTLKKGQVTMGQFFSARFRKDGLAAAQVLSLANARASALETQFIQTGAAAGGMRDALAIRPLQAFNSAAAVSAQKLAIHRAMLQQATTSMINFGKNTQWAGRQLMVGFTVPLTIFGGLAAKTFKELEEQAINFKKVYGDIFTTDEETQAALENVQELSKEFTKYGIAVKDTMALAGVAAQSGLRNAELMAATTQATRLATLGQMEQAEAMQTIISLQTAFKASNEELAESVDFLNIIENQTVLSLQDVAGAIPRVAPVIQGLGGDVKDLAVLLVAMKEGGVTAGEGANALKSSLGRLITPTKRAKEMAAEFGINLDQIVQGNRGQVVPMIQELAKAMNSLGGLEQQQLLSTIFGKFQYARIGALFKSLNDDSSQAARAMDLINMSAEDLAKTANKELATVEEAVGTKMTAAMERLKVAIAPIGEMFLKMATPIINFFASIAEKFNNLPDFAKKFIGLATVITGLVIPAGTMFLGLLMNLVGTLVKFGHIVGVAFKGFTSGGIKGAFDAVSQAVKYMSLAEIDASNAAQQLAGTTQAVNAALLDQVAPAEGSTAAIMGLAGAYDILVQNMRESMLIGGLPMAVPGQAMMRAGRGGASNLVGRPLPIVARNKGGSIPYMSTGRTVPGMGNKDTVPAMLTPGEFVINKKATQQNLGLLHAINDGDVQYRNKGGGIAEMGRKFYGPRPNPYAIAAQQARQRLEQFESSRSAIAGMFGLPISGPRTQRTIQTAASQVSRARRSQDIFEMVASKDTKASRLLRKAVELGLSPERLGLKQIGNLVLEMSPSANMRMANGNLTRAGLTSELSNSSVYGPLDHQLRRYFGKSLNDASFDQIYRQQIGLLPEAGITNQLFEKATRNALRVYMDQNKFSRSQRNAFLRDVLAPDTIRANVRKQDIRNVLAKNNIDFNEDGDDIIAIINGERFNFGDLGGRSIDYMGRSPVLSRYDKIPVAKGMARVHANKGGMIPGVQYARMGRLILGMGRRTEAPKYFAKNIAAPYGEKYGSQAEKILSDLFGESQWSKMKNTSIGRSMLRADVSHKVERRTDLGQKIWWEKELFGAFGAENRGFEYLFGAGRTKTRKIISDANVGMLSPSERRTLRRFMSGVHPTSKSEIKTFLKVVSNLKNYSKANPELPEIKKLTNRSAYTTWMPAAEALLRARLRKRNNLGGTQTMPIRSLPGINVESRNKGGIIPGVQYRNTGGEIFESGTKTIVPGVGNTDTVPAALTPGEFVINKRATQQNKPLLQAINNGKNIPGVQYFSRGGIAQRLTQALMGPKPITNVQQQQVIERQLTNWLDMKMRNTNVRELGKLLGTRQKETELFRGMKMRPSDSGFQNRFPKETQEALYRFARSGNPDDLAGIIGKPVAIAPRSFSTSRKVAQTFGGDPINVGNPQKDAAPLILKLRNQEGIFGFKPTERIGTAKQSGRFVKEKRFYSRGSQNEKEIVPVGDPRRGDRRDVVVGKWGFDGKDVFIDTGAKISRRETSRAIQELDTFTAARFTPRDEIRKTQLEVQRLQVAVERAKRNPGRTSSKELGDLATRLMTQVDRNKLLSAGTRKDRRALERMTTGTSSMLDQVSVMFNRAKSMGMNKGGKVPGIQYLSIGGVAQRIAQQRGRIISSAKLAQMSDEESDSIMRSIFTQSTVDDASGYSRPTFRLANRKDEYVFSGAGESVSGLQVSAGRNVKTLQANPVSLLEEALLVSPNNPKIKSMLSNFKNKRFGSDETKLLDDMAAAMAIDNRGGMSPVEQTSGLALVLASLAGDNKAQSMLSLKRQAFYNRVKTEKEKEKQTLRAMANSAEEASLDELAFVHSTKHKFDRSDDGTVSLKPYAHHTLGTDEAVPRSTLHFTINSKVEDHLMGSWGAGNKVIVTSGKRMFEDNGNPAALRSIDSFWEVSPGQSLRLRNASVVNPHSDEGAYRAELSNRGLIDPKSPTPFLIEDKKTNDVFYLVKQPGTYTEDDRIRILESLKRDASKTNAKLIEGREAQLIEEAAMQAAMNQQNVKERPRRLSQWGYADNDNFDNRIGNLAMRKGISGEIHAGTPQAFLETSTILPSSPYISGSPYNRMTGSNLDSYRWLMASGAVKTEGKAPRPSFMDTLEYNSGGFISPSLKMNTGNMVPGMGNTDTVPAMLTPGEFVVNKKATMENLGLLHAINGGQVQFLNEGGVAGAMVGEGKTWFVDDGKGNLKEFNNEKDATKYAKKVKKSFARQQIKAGKQPGMMRGMGASMGLGMGGMGVMMLGQQMQASAAQRGEASAAGGMIANAGIALSMASILPFLKAGIAIPLAAIAAAIGAAVIALKAFREETDRNVRKAADFGANLGGAANRMEEVAAATGYQFARNRSPLESFKFTAQEAEAASQFTGYFESEGGQKFVEDLQKLDPKARYEEVRSAIAMAIADGMDKETAKAYGDAIAFYTNDALLKSRIGRDIRSGQFATGSAVAISEIEKRTEAAALSLGPVTQAGEMSRSYLSDMLGTGGMTNIIGEAALSTIPFMRGIHETINDITEDGFQVGDLLRNLNPVAMFGTTVSTFANLKNEFDLLGQNAESVAAQMGSSVQILKEVENAEALLGEERKKGIISAEQYNSRLEQLRAIEEEQYSRMNIAIKSASDAGFTSQAISDQLVLSGMTGDLAKTIANATSKNAVAQKMFNENFEQLSEEQQNVVTSVISRTLTGITPENAQSKIAEIENTYSLIAQRLLNAATDGLSALELDEEVLKAQLQNFVSSAFGDVGFGGRSESEQRERAVRNLAQADTLGLRTEDVTGALGSFVDREFALNIASSKQKLSEFIPLVKELQQFPGINLEIITKTEDGRDPEKVAKEIKKTLDGMSKLKFKGVRQEIVDALPQAETFIGMARQAGIEFENIPESFKEIATQADALSEAFDPKRTGALKKINVQVAMDILGADVEDPQALMSALQSAFPEGLDPLFLPILLQVANPEVLNALQGQYGNMVASAIAEGQKSVDLPINAGTSFAGYQTIDLSSTTGISQFDTTGFTGSKPEDTSGGGGGGQKSILEQLKDQFQALKDTYNAMEKFINSKTGVFKKIAAGPFGPQFIEFLKAQGEEGLKILKGDLEKFKQVYNEYLNVQMQSARNVMQNMPQAFKSQAMQQAGTEMINNVLERQGFSAEIIDTIMGSFENPEALAEAYAVARTRKRKGKSLTDQQKELLQMFNAKNMKKILTRAQKVNNQIREEFVSSKEEALELENSFRNTLEGRNISPEVIDMLLEMGYISKDLETNLGDIVSKAQRLDSVLAQTKFTDSMEGMGQEIDQANFALELMGQGAGPEAAAAIAQIGNASTLTNAQIQEFVKTFEELEIMRLAMQDPAQLRLQQLQGQESINQLKYEIELLENINKNETMSALFVKENVDNHEDLLEVYERQNEAKSREIELRQRALEPLDDEIEKLEEQKTKIEETYEKQFEALDQILEKENEIFNTRERMLNVAQALSSGDVAEAAAAALELERQRAEQRREDQRSMLELQRQQETENIDNKINRIKDQRKLIEEDIKRLQLEQRAIQDQIYNTQFIINAEAARLEDKYKLGNNQLAILRAELVAAESEQRKLNAALQEQIDKQIYLNSLKNQTSPAPAPATSSGVEVLRPGDSGYDQITANIQESYGGRPNEMVNISQEQLSAAFGGVGDLSGINFGAGLQGFFGYNMGGTVNYRGSREAAPGMMYGGKMKKYATGSYVAGNGMIDSVPALLTPGEFVVRKPVAQAYGPLLESLNGRVFPRVNFNKAMPAGSAGDSGSMYNYNVNVTLNGADMNPDDVANAVMKKIKMSENTKVRGYNTRG